MILLCNIWELRKYSGFREDTNFCDTFPTFYRVVDGGGSNPKLFGGSFFVVVLFCTGGCDRWPKVPSIGQNLHPFTGNGDVFVLVKILEWDD